MSDEQTPDVEEIKARLGEEIPVEEDAADFKAEQEPDVVAELRQLGRQFGETLRSAWYSEERQQFEHEIREGVQDFAEELDKAFKDIKESQAAQRARSEAAEMKDKAGSAELGQQAQSSMAQGLRWFSEELGRLANQFTPAEKTRSEESAEEEG